MTAEKMNWEKLLSNKRLGDMDRKKHDPGRDHFQQDYDRIVFSSAFRRLQDKTQVFPLSESDYVRRRLTHSLETSCVGRSLGLMVGNTIIKKYHLQNKFAPSHVGSIVASACVAHDLGNPPFGHSGEDAIRLWFHEDGSKYIKEFKGDKKEDFLNYEGNAQGFRLLTRLMHAPEEGGMKLTCATLAAFMKYPRSSCISIKPSGSRDVSAKKHGFFEAERKYFEEVASEVGLISRGGGDAWWYRHPLAYLVEAADDICYGIVDLEDGVRLGHFPYLEAEAALLSICDDSVKQRLKKIDDNKEKIELLRAKSINVLVSQVVDVFIANEEEILSGNYQASLIKSIKHSKYYDKVIEIDRSCIYTARPVIEIEVAGFDVISGLLSAFVAAVEDVAKNGEQASQRSQKIIQLVPKQFIGPGVEPVPDGDSYARLLKMTDFVSGMTDSYAVSLYKKITGISLPTG